MTQVYKVVLNIPARIRSEVLKLIEQDELETSLLNFIEEYRPKIKSTKIRKRTSLTKITLNISSEFIIKLKGLYKANLNSILESILKQRFNFKDNELAYGDLLFLKEEGWKREVSVVGGRIDGINYKLNKIVELKFLAGWKGALGQILVYVDCNKELTNLNKELWLLYEPNKLSYPSNKFETTKKACAKYNVSVRFIPI